MKILVVNGSPQGELSNTLVLTKAFIRGLSREEKHEINWFVVKDKHIEYCQGCLFCWSNPNNKCIWKDDMTQFDALYDDADMVIFSVPVILFGAPAMLKNILDRMIRRSNPRIHLGDSKDESSREFHGFRYKNEKRIVLITTYGYTTRENNIEPLLDMFRIIFKDKLVTIVGAEGPLFGVASMDEKTKPYLDCVENAGYELVSQGEFSPKTVEELKKEILSVKDYAIVVNSMLNNGYWRPFPKGKGQEKEKNELLFGALNQVAVVTDVSMLKDATVVIEFLFTDTGYQAQIIFTRDGGKVIENTGEFSAWNLKISAVSSDFMSYRPNRKLVNGRWVVESTKQKTSFSKLFRLAYTMQRNGLQKEIMLRCS